ncbi:MAG: hypothetical protein AAFR79_16240, partial [Pseudomonadota bacterium]
MDLPSPETPLRIGTRGSPLALAQAYETRDRLMAAHGLPEAAFSVEVISTKGDRIQDRPLSEVGGKGLFTEEIEAGLLAGTGIALPVLIAALGALTKRSDRREGRAVTRRLRMAGFDETVAHVVEGHVLAKRYLCYKEADYHGKLSKGSQRTLEF